jgi:hypothetical protein
VHRAERRQLIRLLSAGWLPPSVSSSRSRAGDRGHAWFSAIIAARRLHGEPATPERPCFAKVLAYERFGFVPAPCPLKSEAMLVIETSSAFFEGVNPSSSASRSRIAWSTRPCQRRHFTARMRRAVEGSVSGSSGRDRAMLDFHGDVKPVDDVGCGPRHRSGQALQDFSAVRNHGEVAKPAIAFVLKSVEGSIA